MTPELMQQVLRFNLFHILQASACSQGAGVAAKGLTSLAYEGHYFWDMEIYVMPFLTYTAPRIAKNLLLFRYSMLDKARQRSREVNQNGALFPWRTINGEEASAYYAAGTAQYHIDADIVYALKKYVEATGDEEFLFKEGVEILVETARMWYSFGFFSKRKGGQFCIHGVTGPDEYNTVVNNNTYTNLMARENLWYAAKTVETLREQNPDWFTVLVHKTNLELSELENWKKAADNIYLPFDEQLEIHLQHDGFLDEEVWDFENTPASKYPLLLHFHPLVIYRHQVIKQADIVLAMFLLGHEFSLEQKQRNFDYYDPLTTGDSSLTVCIQSIVAAEIGYMEKANAYARYAVLMDLGDVAGNVKDGCHIAAMGGTWMVLVYGFGGLRDDNGRLSFHPRLPKTIKRLQFPLTIRGQRLEVDIDRQSVAFSNGRRGNLR
ncbi:glycoside hydrolase family 65 protein [Chroococcidiopsis sp. SAG 2025]|uniref:glycoside hydrolase family 65 protein n=1 Tax=Chroococcidiopsis sp. SAG 2025 TaxID=171389 RepID=UPI0029374765|nr:glycosyl hydrolase family 65 protein [Chroococcidiopsis sp. SAG 2025]